MSINISNTATEYRCASWRVNPGERIKIAETESEAKAERIFNHFIVNKIPAAKKFVDQLIRGHQITEVHLPMNLSMIFFTQLNGLIEYYQLQLGFDARDVKIDEQMQTIKSTFAKERIKIFGTHIKQLQPIFDEIKNKLLPTGLLPPEFDQNISFWKEVLEIEFIADLDLAALYDKRAKSSHLKNGPMHVGIKLSRHCIKQSFFSILSLFSKDYQWIAAKLQKKIVEIQDENLELAIRLLLAKSTPDTEQTIATQFQAFDKEMKACLCALGSLNFDDNLACSAMIDQLQAVWKRMDKGDCAEAVENIQDVGGLALVGGEFSDKQVILTEELSSRVIPCLQDLDELFTLNSFYLVDPIKHLLELLQSLKFSNDSFENFKKTGERPPLASQLPPLLPSFAAYDEKIVDELLSTPSTKTQKGQPQKKSAAPKKNQRGKNVKAKPGSGPTPQPQQKPKPAVKTSPAPAPSVEIVVSAPVPAGSIEHLKTRLQNLHLTTHSKSLRQALWHLDTLISILNSLEKSQLSAPECLALTDMTINSAQKLLEQIYCFCLKEEEMTSSHNLRDRHRQFDPDCTHFPPSVKELYLANHWFRYFYIYHERAHALTTQQFSPIPPILDTLVEMAEGRALSPTALETLVKGMIDRARSHAEHLLESVGVPPEDSQLPPVENPPVKLAPLQLNVFSSVEKALRTFLTNSHLNSHHPVYLHIKQTLSALKMLETSVRRMNRAKDLHELSIWTVWSVQQVQESIENVLHAIEFFQCGATSIEHELKELSAKVDLKMGSLAEACTQLSYKARYPAEKLVNGSAAQIIDDLEALKQYPDLLIGFGLPIVANRSSSLPKMLWKIPSEGVSLEHIMANLTQLMIQSKTFLSDIALPALNGCL
jgi:hypothetical protein